MSTLGSDPNVRVINLSAAENPGLAYRGTRSSNPSPSSGESVANSILPLGPKAALCPADQLPDRALAKARIWHCGCRAPKVDRPHPSRWSQADRLVRPS